ncbi:MAG: O-antigen ligase family protein [Elusimicrobiota bacterium]
MIGGVNYLISLILLITPAMCGSLDLWIQTIIRLLILILILISILKKEISLHFSHSLSVPLFLFLFFCFISIFSSANLYESKNEFFNILTYIAFFYFAKNVDRKYIIVPVLISGVVLSLYAFYQKFNSCGNSPSFMNNPNVFAGYLVGCMLITFSFTTTFFSSAQNKIRIILLSLFFLALFFTGSMAGLISAILGVLFFVYLKKIVIQKKYLFIICGIIIFLLIAKFFEKQSFDRVVWWLTAGKMILARPISGVGLGAFADAYQKYKLVGLNSLYAHNYFLQLASEIGVFGFTAFIWFLIKIFKFRKTSENIPFFAAIFAMLFHSIFDYTLTIPANAILFWLMLCCCSSEERLTSIPLAQNYKTIFRWIAIFLILWTVHSQVMIFLASRNLAIGKYCFDKKKYDIAEIHFLNAIKYDNKNPQAYFFLSNVHQQYYKITSYKSYLFEAEIELLSAAKLQKYNPQIYFDLFNGCYLRGDMQNAVLWMKKTLDVAPKSVYYEKCYENLLKEIHNAKK